MRLTETKIRQIIREEARRVLREATGEGLVISGYDLDVEYNDSELGTQQARLVLDVSYNGEPLDVAFTIIGFSYLDERDFIGDSARYDVVSNINWEIENVLGIDDKLTTEEVREQLAPHLSGILRELEQADRDGRGEPRPR